MDWFVQVVLAACVLASAQAGLVGVAGVSGVSYAAGPALGAPLLGKVSYNAPETTIVKQQVVVDQPEIRVRHVPTVVQTAPIVKTIQPVIQAAPAVTYAAAPAVQTWAAPALTYAPAIQNWAAPAIQNWAAPALTYSAGIPTAINSGLVLNNGLIGQNILLKK